MKQQRSRFRSAHCGCAVHMQMQLCHHGGMASSHDTIISSLLTQTVS